ncbi:MAG: flagellar hook basal-body protein [Pseudomonadota bacterium]
MANGIYVALSGANAQARAVDVVSYNIANAGTTGFRGQKAVFGEALAQAGAQGGATRQDSAYATLAQVATDASQGELVNTENPFDLALVGDGFFVIDTARGPRYTRAGNFRLDTEGVLVDNQGNMPRTTDGGHLQVPANTKSVQVEGDGTVVADGEIVGTLELACFTPESMIREGAIFYNTAPNAVRVGALPEVLSGALESSNVNPVRGMVDLIRMSRSYESLVTAIESYRQIDGRVARDIGGPK